MITCVDNRAIFDIDGVVDNVILLYIFITFFS